ncbi:cytochrome c oxidase subunit 6, mitochondrial [Verruconis gallopava]|uniref:Cytochrome c oxidase subunit 6, mitochondrial n=1 Tax=Verruconis gallopava TaxID=253628 RepID=A0A0D1XXD5_9PEZI|nr:cytochrome c oxidase subunit 6, mitochondrial [Verruconis gallopava]KIW07431.1 cytochrome c oxidase subunit 6, mitochondrial [Verruconis gallopava]
MASTTMFRAATRSVRVLPRVAIRSTAQGLAPRTAVSSFSTTMRRRAGGEGGHHEETYEEFTQRYENEFNNVQDVFELQRNLNNAFAYDLVPSPSVIIAALRAARRVNDFPTAVRIFEGIEMKVENKGQYEEYLKELEPIREELGISLKETMYPEGTTSGRDYDFGAYQAH